MSNLKDRLIRLGSQSPDLRQHLKPILDNLGSRTASGNLVRECRSLLRDWSNFADDISSSPVVGNSFDLMSDIDGVKEDLEDVVQLLGNQKYDPALDILDMAIDTVREDVIAYLDREKGLQVDRVREADNHLAKMEMLKDTLMGYTS